MTLTPYINLPGTAEEAMNFYQTVFGGEIQIQRWSEMPPDEKMPLTDEWKQKVMHGSLTIRDGITIYLSDSWTDNSTPINNAVFLHVEFDSEEEVRRAFAALSEGAQINMPIEASFWGAIYGDLVDQFGTGWGLHFQLPDPDG